VKKFFFDESPSGDAPVVKMKLPDGRIVDHRLDPSSSCSMAFNAAELPLRERGAIRDLRVGPALSYLMRGRDVIQAVVSLAGRRGDALFCTRPECRPCTLGRRWLARPGA
jgi:hypothetical protein